MGLFSSKKKDIVDTTVVRVVEDNLLPAPMQQAVIEALFQERSISNVLLDRALNGSHRNFEAMYRFAQNGGYFYGLPDTRVLNSNQGESAAAAVLRGLVPNLTQIDYLQFRPFNNVHAAFKTLTESWNYSHADNSLSPPGFPVDNDIDYFLEAIVATHGTAADREPDQAALGNPGGASTQSGATPDNPMGSAGTVDQIILTEDAVEGAHINLIWVDNLGEIQRSSVFISFAGFSTDDEVYIAKYRFNEEGISKIGYWTYNPDTRLYPELDGVFAITAQTNAGTYFPFVVFRAADENRTAEEFHNTEAYTSSAKLLDYLGMDFQELGDTIHENPDIEDVRQAVMMMGVPINSQDQLELAYLHTHFKNLQQKLPDTGDLFNQALDPAKIGKQDPLPNTLYSIEYSDADFRMMLSVDAISSRITPAKIGVVGTYSNSLQLTPITNLFFTDDIRTGMKRRQSRVFRRQITADLVEEIHVTNPRLKYQIFGDRFSEPTLDDDARFLIPLDYSVIRSMPSMDREVLYQRSLHFVFNSHIVQKVKWYETGIFKALLMIAAIVITIVFKLPAWKAAITTAGAAAGSLALGTLLVLVGELVNAIVFKFVFTELADAAGLDTAFAIAVAAVIAGGVQGIRTGSLAGGGALSAQNLLTVANGLIRGIQENLKSLFQDLQSGVEEFAEFREAKLAELEELEDLLDAGLDLDPLTFVRQQPLFIAGESPDAYFNRTVHNGNPGIRGMEILQNFVDLSLRLPSAEDTIGNTFYGLS